jgi:hypothetical protein
LRAIIETLGESGKSNESEMRTTHFLGHFPLVVPGARIVALFTGLRNETGLCWLCFKFLALSAVTSRGSTSSIPSVQLNYDEVVCSVHDLAGGATPVDL